MAWTEAAWSSFMWARTRVDVWAEISVVVVAMIAGVG
eukprot:CAMPEP_0201635002 /NCGR_PEP_ID=MMETSP0493-20130528/7717_1 /ASSEMBLY_ACC=CAM_ASM_000838 /TAXON_ID=420259 /ORGANISM="Thalassiosira gravida, Strain GMp14c1" /LENGTH=36 /DNA_ID= /DNA_START= /DNA_END= /DNA_ORIENTATION=